jgi:hypothetical protein
VKQRGLSPPSGYPPPEVAQTAEGGTLRLRALAEEICRRYRAEFPDEQERYGDAGTAWCVHDNQHILNWVTLESRGFIDLEERLAWLARVLEARDFPLQRLARNLELAAEVVREDLSDADHLIAERLSSGARYIRSKPSFLE